MSIRKHSQLNAGLAPGYIVLLVVCLICLAPFFMMVVASLKPVEDIFSFPMPVFSTEFVFDNYVQIFKDYNFASITWNTFYVSALFTLLTTYFSAMCGYAVAKYNFKLKNTFFIISLACLFIPFESTMIPLYILFKNLKMINSHIGLIIPTVSRLSFGIFFVRQYLSGINNELIESGRIDGAGELGIFHRIIPAFATLGILFFMFSWNNYLWPLIIINSSKKMTISIALTNLQSANANSTMPPYHLIMAGAVISTVPMVAVFLRFQKFFISGITDGAVKG